MRWLFLDTHAPDAFRWGFLSEQPVIEIVAGRAHDLLALLPPVEELKERIDGIVVVEGPGTFTALRTGVLTANILARQLSLPLVGVTVTEAEDVTALIQLLSTRTPVDYVAPVYDREPNITTPKTHDHH
ncbi:MAG: hypothetical protein Q7R83_00570 [bacterium]|nr:hypothetical protein [bacterium]